MLVAILWAGLIVSVVVSIAWASAFAFLLFSRSERFEGRL